MATLPRAAGLCWRRCSPGSLEARHGGHLAVAIFGDADKLEDGQCCHGLLPGGPIINRRPAANMHLRLRVRRLLPGSEADVTLLSRELTSLLRAIAQASAVLCQSASASFMFRKRKRLTPAPGAVIGPI
jgi:hypothetical protein